MVAPNPVTDPQGALSSMALDPMRQMMLQSQQGYQNTQEQIGHIKEQVKNAPQTDDAERWAAMAQAAATVPPVVGNFGALLAQVGGAYGKTLASQRQAQLTREMELAKLMQQSTPLGSGSMTSMTAAMLNPIQNIGGVGVNRLTGQTVVPKELTQVWGKHYADALKNATEQKMENPEDYARQQADAIVQQYMLSNPSVAGSLYAQRPGQAPLPAQGGANTQPPPAATPAQVDLQPAGAPDTVVPGEPAKPITQQGADPATWIAQLKQDEKKAVAEGDYARALEVKKALVALQSSAPPQPAAPQGLKYKDTREAKFKETWGGKEAETLEKALTESSKTLGSASNLVSTLNSLEGLLNIDNMPEGKFAPIFVEGQSALKSFGVDLKGPTGPAQVASAMANEMALRLRTGSGENLMPGAMSNFDAQLLLSMTPSLSQTREGRNTLLKFMRDAAESQRRIAEAAQAFASKNNGMLTPEWRKVAADMEKQEMAKRELFRRQVMKQFGGK